MIDLSLPLQAAIVKALKEDAELIGLIGGRVYDRVPDNPVAPYITVGDMQVVDDSNPCQSLAEYSGLVDCWSEAVGYPEVKRIGAAAVRVLNAKLPVTGGAIIIHRVGVSYARERDNLTSRAIIRPRYDIQAQA
ncbi:DUF3168 domain-containing protein [Brevundimonas diminuta]|uniref:DUF3168 domain-containing protein n=1 Tax=Brevundimonas diminuta TaxID=293 RepID=UPI003208FFF9